MDPKKPEISGMTIVLIGDFSPPIIQPAWLAARGLIRDQEAEKAEIKIIHPEIVDLRMEWLSLNVTRNRFTALTTQEPFFEPLRDLVHGIFSLLSQTPIGFMGINREMHYEMESEAAWHSFGHWLAPKDAWNDLLTKPGLQNLTILSQRQDNYKGAVSVIVEPSTKIKYGVYFRVNDHYETSSPDQSSKSPEIAMAILKESWEDSNQRAEKIIHSLLEKRPR
jgi:hypothetical protein